MCRRTESAAFGDHRVCFPIINARRGCACRRGKLRPALDEFVAKVVPLLQERGSLRAEYTGSTLRDNLGLPVPDRTPATAAAS